jgi:hypothetical protein
MQSKEWHEERDTDELQTRFATLLPYLNKVLHPSGRPVCF